MEIKDIFMNEGEIKIENGEIASGSITNLQNMELK